MRVPRAEKTNKRATQSGGLQRRALVCDRGSVLSLGDYSSVCVYVS